MWAARLEIVDMSREQAEREYIQLAKAFTDE